jgi:hypothetical protein
MSSYLREWIFYRRPSKIARWLKLSHLQAPGEVLVAVVATILKEDVAVVLFVVEATSNNQ